MGGFHQVDQQFGDVHPFLQEQTELSPATRSKLLRLMADPPKNARLQVELAVVIDAGERFVKATYSVYVLEGDGPLTLNCYEVLSTLTAGIHVQRYPNLEVVAQKLSGATSAQQWVDYGRHVLHLVYSTFTASFQEN